MGRKRKSNLPVSIKLKKDKIDDCGKNIKIDTSKHMVLLNKADVTSNQCRADDYKKVESDYSAKLNFHDLNTVKLEQGISEYQFDKISQSSRNRNITICGSYNQANIQKFGISAGTQCVANSLMSIIFSDLFEIATWNTTTLDRILEEGNKLYNLIRNSSSKNEIYLLINELPRTVEFCQKTFTLNISQESQIGFIGINSSQNSNIAMPLNEALQMTLLTHANCFITIASSTFSVMKRNNKFYIFDSHSRNHDGMVSVDGTSILKEFDTIDEVYTHCINLNFSLNCPQDSQFEVTGINVDCVDGVIGDDKHLCIKLNIKRLNTKPFIQTENDISYFKLSDKETDDVCISHIENSVLKFHPLTGQTRRRLCTLIGVATNSDALNDLSMCRLKQPTKIASIQGDGNCFFRSLSYAINSSQDSHYKIRLALVRHMKAYKELFSPFLRPEYKSVEEYIRLSKMRNLGTWATEIEIMCAAEFFQINIYTFRNNRWLKFSPLQGECIEEGIYINHRNGNHFEVVLDVERTKIIEVIDVTFKESELSTPSDSDNKIKKAHDFKSSVRRLSRKRGNKWIAKKSHVILSEKKYEKKPKLQHAKYCQKNENISVTCESSKRVRHRNDQQRITDYHYAEHRQDVMSRKFYDKLMPKLNSNYDEDQNYKNKLRHLNTSLPNETSMCKKIAQGTEKYSTNISNGRKVDSHRNENYWQDKDHRQVKTVSRHRYRFDPNFAENHRKNVTYKYHSDANYRNKARTRSSRQYHSDANYRNKARTRSSRQYHSDANYRRRDLRRKSRKYHSDANYRNKSKKFNSDKYKHSLDHRKKRKRIYNDKKISKINELKNKNKAIDEFRKEAACGPVYVCSVCNRLLFFNQVMNCNEKNYKKSYIVNQIAEKCISKTYLHVCNEECRNTCSYPDCSKSLWICYTCHRKILQGKTPAESISNNLDPGQIPPELNCLNQLEKHLISKNLVFLKLVRLSPQHDNKVVGEAVCVPSNITEMTNVLPRCENDNQLIRIKLKKRLSHKGYYEFQGVTKNKIKNALNFLRLNNSNYFDVALNSEWMQEQDTNIMENNESLSNQNNNDHKNEDDDDDFVDDNIAKNIAGIHDTCLQPINIMQEVLDNNSESIFSISPGENNKPIRLLMDKTCEQASFPYLFPTGKATFSDDREVPITLGRYLHCRLMNVDNRFARSSDFLFYAQYIYELSQVLSSVSIALRQTKMGGNRLTADMLAQDETLKNLFKADYGYRFMKNIRGSPAYWQGVQKDLFAMIRQLGIPTWFASFSCAEMRWTEFIEVLLKQQGDTRKVSDLDWLQKREILRSNPITLARMFDHRFKIFFKKVIMTNQCIGNVIDYFSRIEFQARGAPHVHCVLWVSDSPKVDVNTDEEVVSFIDKYVTCNIPDKSHDPELHEIITNVQKHSSKHSKSCRKNNKVCRFNFPRPPSNRTFICRQLDKDNTEHYNDVNNQMSNATDKILMKPDQAKVILESIWKELSCDKTYNSLSQLYHELGISEDIFEEACQVLTKKTYLILKRNIDDVYINQYNPDLLRAWNGNLDLQFVFDAYACVVYIVSYITKAEKEMGQLLQQSHEEAKQGNLDAKASMRKISTTYLHCREVSAQESAFRVCNIQLKDASRKVQFIPTGEHNIRMTLPIKVLKSRAKEGTLTDENMFMTSIVDRYRNRPKGEPFDNICLASFCSEYRVMPKSENPNVHADKNPAFKLQNDLGYIIKRSRAKPAVIRYARFSITANPENFYLSGLQLFLPHRNTVQLKPPVFETYEEFYKSGCIKMSNEMIFVKDIVDENRKLFEKDDVNIESIQEMVEKLGTCEDAWASICPETEQSRLETELLRKENESDNLEEDNDPNIPDIIVDKSTNGDRLRTEPNICSISKTDAIPLLRSLNKIQSDVFYKVRQFCLDKLHGKARESLRVFVHGSGGTGKSHLIKCIYYEASRLFAKMVDNLEDVTVLLCAPTGVSAFNIGASTIHSTFSIKTNAALPYQPLGPDSINTLRSKYSNLQILIIDEISMVDHKLLCYIHGRLRQIMGTNLDKLFGNVSIICFGDMYQLKPVKGKGLWIENDIFDLWNGHFKIVQLQEIMRQKDDLAFAEVLNRLRIRKKKEDILPADIAMLQSRVTGEENDSLHIFSTNAQVDDYNRRILTEKFPDFMSISALDYSKDAKTGKMKLKDNHVISADTSLPPLLLLGIGARVMLVVNLNVSLGLTNGSFGTVTFIEKDLQNEPIRVYVKFDNAKIDNSTEQTKLPFHVPVGSIMIEKHEDKINYKGDIRRQFPLKLAYAVTIHKVQGLSLDKCVISLHKIFQPGQSYVALSRVRNVEGLIIQNFDQKTIYCDETIEDSINSMEPFLHIENEMLNGTVFILHNVQGLFPHIDDIKNDKRFLEADFICLTETWINNTRGCDKTQLDKYMFYNNSRKCSYDDSAEFINFKSKEHGGVGLYYKQYCSILKLGVINIEHLAFNVPDKNINVIIIYRPPDYGIELFLKQLNRLLTELIESGYEYMVMGDFNQNILVGNSSIEKCFNKFGFAQCVSDFTTEGGTLIDHVYISRGIKKHDIRIKLIPTYYSYHEAIQIIFS